MMGSPYKTRECPYTGAPIPAFQQANGEDSRRQIHGTPGLIHAGRPHEQAAQRACQQRLAAQTAQGKSPGCIRRVRHLRPAGRQDIEDTTSDERRSRRAHTSLTRRRSIQLRELQAHAPQMQQDEERQDRRTRTSAAGWQTGSESKLDAVQNVRHLTPIPGRGPRVHPLPVASGAVPISPRGFKRRKQGKQRKVGKRGLRR